MEKPAPSTDQPEDDQFPRFEFDAAAKAALSRRELQLAVETSYILVAIGLTLAMRKPLGGETTRTLAVRLAKGAEAHSKSTGRPFIFTAKKFSDGSIVAEISRAGLH